MSWISVLEAAVRLLNLLTLVLLLPTLQVTAENTLILSPPEVVVFEGGSAVLSCSPFFPKEPPTLIQQDLIVLTTSTEPRLSFRDFVTLGDPHLSNRTYTVRGVIREDDRTRFRCVIGDVQSSEATLMVYVPPELTGPSGQRYVMEGSPFEQFHYMELLGLPPPHSFTWQLNGHSFSGKSRIWLLENNSTLSVRFASRVDSGNYTLTVVSDSGSRSLNLELIVTFDEFTEAPKSCTVEEGETVTLNCEHRFGLTYDWVTADREPIGTLGNKVSVSNSGRTLSYGPVNFTDHLLSFLCVVSSVDEVRFFESPPATLSVRAPPRVSAPVKTSAIEVQNVEVVLPFSVNSFPPPLSWIYTHNDMPLESSARITTLTGGSVLIRNPTRSDAGRYMLTVENSRGTNSAVIILEIFYPPELSALNGPHVAQFNKTVIIPCGTCMEVTGQPPPTYQWVRQDPGGGGALISLPETFSVNTSTGDVTLTPALYEDAGSYLCNATNSVGSSSIPVNLLVLDPPGPPVSVTPSPVGRTWAFITWSPPSDKGSIGVISNYTATAVPHPFSGSENSSNGSGEDSWSLVNSSCIEYECKTRREDVLGSETAMNLTNLIQGVQYSLTLTAFSNGSNLQSAPSQLIKFTTLAYVPGVGFVTSIVDGPGSANVSWTLAYSGGLPVQSFIIEYRRNDTATWQRARSEGEKLNIAANSSVSPTRRSHIVRNLESEELYEFRVAGSNRLGTGDFRHVDEPLLSHEIGVPSPPSQPRITSWKEGCATIAANLSKFGSRLDFSLGYILILNGTQVQTVVGIEFHGNYTLGERVEITVANITYMGDWQVAVLASNYLGCSLLSDPSLRARENIQYETPILTTVGIAVWSVMSVVNIIIMATSAVVLRVIGWEAKKQKRGLARRLEIARDQTECPMSPRSLCTFGDIRSSPDGRSNNLVSLTTNGSLVEESAGFQSCFPLAITSL